MRQNSWRVVLPPFRKYKKEVFKKAAETGQFIYQIGEYDALRQKSAFVSLHDIQTDVFQAKIKYLKRCIKRYRKITGVGRGITAVQVGIPECFSVIFMPEVPEHLMIIINPKIIKKSKQHLWYSEMCMSANPFIARVARPAWIEFEYYDEKGEKKRWTTKDDAKEGRMYNRVFQHEIDHMKGVINIDLVKSSELIFESDPQYYDTVRFEAVK